MTTLKLYTRLAMGLTSVAAAFVLTASGSSSSRFRIFDRCDPVSFTAADIGCLGNGDVTLTQFSAELQKDQQVNHWAYETDKEELDFGTTVQLQSQAGETHTFTKVAEFGGGFVPT